MTPTDPLNDAFGRLNVEGAAFTDGHASPIDSGLLPRRDNGLHHVARGKPVVAARHCNGRPFRTYPKLMRWSAPARQ